MDLRDMSVLNLMKKNVTNATVENVMAYAAEIPGLLAYAETSPREQKLALMEISRSIVEKMAELVPDVTLDPAWKGYADLKDALDKSIPEVRFAVR